ncbi:MAG TPA: DUF3592 domain-containing protein [Polyangiaceae bacterium]|jgi:hypothetical protein|nr:DUF3592 domain-containing protein [Polyangiaceae bacterium]
MGSLANVSGLIAFIAACLCFPLFIAYFLDRRTHEGVDWFKRRRTLSRGQSAEATILSATLLTDRNTGSKYSAAYSIVYEVRPEGEPPFRGRGLEVMYFSEAHANRVDTGQVVDVRFDPNDRTIVLVRIDARKAKLEKDAARRAKEDALLGKR